jgi:UDP-N-acetylglucosamine 2-epimerase (non-hydrolysing)/GDP/UDP-N,N'-diacetylbacillosamine 2-epimerase (hydrolysing)
VAHIAGGDLTEGAYDDALRHSMTKMAHMHFTTNVAATRRVRQMGEDPRHVYNVGSPALDLLRSMTLLERATLEKELDIKLRARNLLVTFHPVTLDAMPSTRQFEELLAALQTFDDDTGLYFTYPNADDGGRALARMLEEFVAKRSNAVAFQSLGPLRYWSLLAQCDAMVGNSSSGLYEAPSFKVPTVNIGSRQSGRMKATSVIDCAPQRDAIEQTIQRALTLDCRKVINPYGDGHSAARIVATLAAIPDFKALLQKHFHDLEPGHDE